MLDQLQEKEKQFKLLVSVILNWFLINIWQQPDYMEMGTTVNEIEEQPDIKVPGSAQAFKVGLREIWEG